ncbi:MAG: hypothetical protein KAS32_20025 [Candidatus Peribacteraceae bacterium]|nr:hypothetical protein [Candidatus Peribacteraceae bacterium]
MKEMDLNKFCELGILQEVNRVFFHPLGLALSVEAEALKDIPSARGDGTSENDMIVGLSAVLETDDPDGIVFGDIDYDKVAKFKEWANGRTPTRVQNLKFKIQPSIKLTVKLDKKVNEDKDG